MSQIELSTIATMYNNVVDKCNQLTEAERNMINSTESLINLSKMILRKENKK